MTRSLFMKHLLFQYIRQSLYLLVTAVVFNCSVLAAPKPDYRLFPHNQGNIQLVMSNDGGFGDVESDIAGNNLPVLDPLTGEMIFGSVYPRNSGAHYLRGLLWIGARVGNDTIVALGTALNPDVAAFGEFTLKSLDVTREYYAEDARSQLDLICTFYDTFTDPAITDPINLTLYEPLGLRIDQHSMAWGGGGIDDFVLIDYTLTNIQAKALKDLFVGIEILSVADPIPDFEFDNLTGYLPRYQFDPSCSYMEDLHRAYVFDNNGDPVYGAWTPASPNATMGVAVLGLSADDYIVNYNWYTWVNSTSWGPRRRGTPGQPLRRFKWGLGEPSGSGEQYYFMAHPEIDYDQIFTALDHSNTGWLPPPSRAGQVASGGGARSVAVLSAGPVVDLGPGQIAHFTVAVVGGEHFHHDPTAYSRLWDP